MFKDTAINTKLLFYFLVMEIGPIVLMVYFRFLTMDLGSIF